MSLGNFLNFYCHNRDTPRKSCIKCTRTFTNRTHSTVCKVTGASCLSPNALMMINNQMTKWYVIYFCSHHPVVPASPHSIDYKSKTLRRYIPNRQTYICITVPPEHASPQIWLINCTHNTAWKGHYYKKSVRTKGLKSHHYYELALRSPRP
jgi:hypothetical protein